MNAYFAQSAGTSHCHRNPTPVAKSAPLGNLLLMKEKPNALHVKMAICRMRIDLGANFVFLGSMSMLLQLNASSARLDDLPQSHKRAWKGARYVGLDLALELQQERQNATSVAQAYIRRAVLINAQRALLERLAILGKRGVTTVRQAHIRAPLEAPHATTAR